MKSAQTVVFEAKPTADGRREGDGGWVVKVDGVEVVDFGLEADLDISNHAFDPLWQALGISIEFDFD